MDRYIVISQHTSEECKMAVKQFRKYNSGFLTHFEWGCARMAVPPVFREKTRVVKLTYFDPMKTEDPFHK